MKKWLALLICISLLVSLLCACGSGANDNSAQSAGETGSSPDEGSPAGETPSADESREEDESSAVSEEESSAPEQEPEKDWPLISGTFIQPSLLSSMTVRKMQKHCDNLLEAGIDTIILQWSVTDHDGSVTGAFYPCKVDPDHSYNIVTIDKLLEACQSRGVKVVMGLNSPDNWFSAVLEDEEWYRREAELGVKIAREIYGLYKEKFPETLAAWYFVPEYYNGLEHNDRAAEFLNLYIDGLNEIDPSMPLYFSPFLRSSVSTKATEEQLKEIFSLTHFREGDVFMPQDSVGAGGIQLAQLDDYFAALKRAVDTCPGLVFMANNECFTTTYKPAPFIRVVQQLQITSKYTSGSVTFAYSHYVSPDIKGNSDLHNEYVRYYQTGEYDVPEVNERENYDGEKTLVSEGKAYTGPTNTRGDLWDDDGTKLTDGEIATCDGNTSAYFGAQNNGAEIIIDLGEITQNLSEFDIYDTFGNWGITSLESVTYYVSDDGVDWTRAGDTVYAYMLEFESTYGGWSRYDFRCVPKAPMSGRYVKAVIENGGWMWISEFCVYTYDDAE